VERRPLAGVTVTRFALGCAPLAGLYEPVPEPQARATVDAAWEHGVRTFDTAPHYGAGLSERRLGAALRDRPRDEFVVCTKVGRLLVPAASPHHSMFADEPPLDRVFDFSRDGARRSLEDSLARLGLDRADVVHVHDPDNHVDEAIAGALPALAELRDAGAIGAVGAAANRPEPLARIVREADVDCVLIAGRHTLLDQSAAAELLPLCGERGVAVIAAGVLNSGVLGDPRPGAAFDYLPAPAATLERARRIAGVCERHGVPLTTAAIAFPLRHPAVTCVLVGARSPAEVADDAAAFERPLPEELWEDLVAERLLPEAAAAASPIRSEPG
jgi:D-threo-aldose 1-dehydrogenase